MRKKRSAKALILPIYGLSAACVLGQCWETSNNQTCATSGQGCSDADQGHFHCTVSANATCDENRDKSATSGGTGAHTAGCPVSAIWDDSHGVSHSGTISLGNKCYVIDGAGNCPGSGG